MYAWQMETTFGEGFHQSLIATVFGQFHPFGHKEGCLRGTLRDLRNNLFQRIHKDLAFLQVKV